MTRDISVRQCMYLTFAWLLLVARNECNAWTTSRCTPTHRSQSTMALHSSAAKPSAASAKIDTKQAIASLKSVLTREYASFFNPMERNFYSKEVSFVDPLTSLTGVDAYQLNVDMLASRTLLGKILFRDAGIILHKIEGGDVLESGDISDIVTRWTLRMTVKVIPWTPTARFSGISVYKVAPGGPMGVQVTQQLDYWDSINIQKGGTYEQVDKGAALKDFFGQLAPDNLQAPSAGAELPYQLLRRGRDYEVRKYPTYTGVETAYARRDQGYETLDYVTSGKSPLAPALMTVQESGDEKTMQWPMAYALPGESSPPKLAIDNDRLQEQSECQTVHIPERVVAVGLFKDASLEPVVRRADKQLRAALQRDGINIALSGPVTFGQYDAVFSIGQRRGEVWIPLEDAGATVGSSGVNVGRVEGAAEITIVGAKEVGPVVGGTDETEDESTIVGTALVGTTGGIVVGATGDTEMVGSSVVNTVGSEVGLEVVAMVGDGALLGRIVDGGRGLRVIRICTGFLVVGRIGGAPPLLINAMISLFGQV
ncbi:hypothetical protein MPSEU_000729500 [Mayamaea pseudoterrestris]|nr:hypothetical protein MPSEU_000729500 [Mayamaea pseudoterrestris]